MIILKLSGGGTLKSEGGVISVITISFGRTVMFVLEDPSTLPELMSLDLIQDLSECAYLDDISFRQNNLMLSDLQ